jgi:TonB-linked SusC/RagA family outer membrane protein
MRTKLLFFLLLLFGCFGQVFAQNREVKGRITDAANGEGLPAISIFVKGTTIGTVSEIDGSYKINVSEGAVLVFQSVGYITQELAVNSQSEINIQLVPNEKQLSEVVVTGVAIEREKRSLGYSIANLDGEQLLKARETNLVNSLSGKIAGLQITNQSGNIGASSRIVIRGGSALTGNNQPLFVIDGVPVSNSNFDSGNSVNVNNANRTTGGVDNGNRAMDFNPDDVESINVLKGAAAAALYGQRAQNGVVLITTKRGKSRQGTISINSSIRFESPLRLPDMQNEYGPGNQGKYNVLSINGWGPRVTGQSVIQFDDPTTARPLVIEEDNNKNFYDVGRTLINNVAFSKGGDKSDLRFSYSNLSQRGIVPNSFMERHNISINIGNSITDKLHTRLSINYVNTAIKGIVAQGGNSAATVIGPIAFPRTYEISRVQNYLNPDGTQRFFPQNSNNPYWIINKNVNTNNVERVFGFAEASYDIMQGLKLTGRFGIDTYSDKRTAIIAKGTGGLVNGQYSESYILEQQLNSDLYLSYDKKFGDNFTFKAIVGHNFNQQKVSRVNNTARDLIQSDLYTYTNAITNTPILSRALQRLVGVYADVTVGFKNYLFLNVTTRNDWNSTLPKSNRSYLYPSANLSFVFTEAFKLSNDILSYGKIRVNYAQVGSGPIPYQLDFRYFPVATVFGQFSTTLTFPFGGRGGYNATPTLPDPNLRPQKTDSYEIGAELGFFNGRIGLDFTYYDIRTNDQIVTITNSSSTGFTTRTLNAGQLSNKGVEISLSGTPIKSDKFSWDIAVNFTHNIRIVEVLPAGISQLSLTSAFNGIEVRALPGERLGLYGGTWQRDPQGNVIINASTGLRAGGGVSVGRLGNIDPDFLMGIQNSFSFLKNFNFSFLIDWRQGGVLFSQTVSALRTSGLAKETAISRENPFIDPGVIANPDGTFSPNTIPVRDAQQWWANYAQTAVAESSTFDATFIKLREVRFSYNLPSTFLSKTFIKSVNIGIEARNLWLIQSKVPHIDPEASLFGSGSNGAAIEWAGMPSTRTWGFNLGLTF